MDFDDTTRQPGEEAAANAECGEHLTPASHDGTDRPAAKRKRGRRKIAILWVAAAADAPEPWISALPPRGHFGVRARAHDPHEACDRMCANGRPVLARPPRLRAEPHHPIRWRRRPRLVVIPGGRRDGMPRSAG